MSLNSTTPTENLQKEEIKWKYKMRIAILPSLFTSIVTLLIAYLTVNNSKGDIKPLNNDYKKAEVVFFNDWLSVNVDIEYFQIRRDIVNSQNIIDLSTNLINQLLRIPTLTKEERERLISMKNELVELKKEADQLVADFDNFYDYSLEKQNNVLDKANNLLSNVQINVDDLYNEKMPDHFDVINDYEDSLKKANGDLYSELQRLKNENTSLKGQLNQKNNRISILEGEIISYQKKLDSANVKYSDIETKFNKAKKDISERDSTIEIKDKNTTDQDIRVDLQFQPNGARLNKKTKAYKLNNVRKNGLSIKYRIESNKKVPDLDGNFQITVEYPSKKTSSTSINIAGAELLLNQNKTIPVTLDKDCDKGTYMCKVMYKGKTIAYEYFTAD